MNFLFTCAGRRDYLFDYFRRCAGGPHRVVGADMSPTAPALAACDAAYLVPSVDDPGYLERVAAICERESIDLVVSLHDIELPLLARGRERLQQVGARVLVSSAEVIDVCFDKLRTRDWLGANGFRVPWTGTDVATAEQALRDGALHFPLVVKPRWGLASTAVHTVESVEELRAAFILTRARLESGVLAAVSRTDGQRAVLIQAHLPGVEHGIDVLNDFDGVPRSVYVKEKLGMRSGETERSCLRDRPDLVRFGQELGRKLGHVGNLDCDVFVDGSEAHVLELNPRFGGGYPFSHAAGADYPGAIVAWLGGRAIDCDAFERRHDVLYAKTVSIVESKVADEIG